MISGIRIACVVLAVAGASVASGSADDESARAEADRPLVRVNGQAITRGDLDFAMLVRRIPPERRDAARRELLELLIDARLMSAWLAERNAQANPVELDAQVEGIHRMIRRTGDDPHEVLSRLGYTDETLRRALALPLAWRTHVNRAVTPQRLRDYFRQHREEFDGTQVRASQIVLQIPADREDERNVAEEKLRQVRADILAGRLTFAEAARRHSDSPSGDAGGDVGFLPFRGRMPQTFSRAVFPLKTGEVSDVFHTPFGVHLAVVTDRKAGDLSLEDVRPQVLDRLQRELWDELVRERRASADIEWLE